MKSQATLVDKSVNSWIKKNKYDKELITISSENTLNSNKLILNGKVLLSRQKNEIEKELNFLGFKLFKNKITVLSDIKYNDFDEWGLPKKKFVNVRQNKSQNKISTQINQNDNYFKILYKNSKESLVQLEDLTLGWIYNKEILFSPNIKNYWLKLKRITKNKTIYVSNIKKLVKIAENYINTPYLLGGKTNSGIDCSGFIQIILKKSFNLILPKHALDQFSLGKRISLSALTQGDLLFARVKGKNIFHVGLVIIRNKTLFIIHASRHAKKVIIEPKDIFCEKYLPAGARRILVERKN